MRSRNFRFTLLVSMCFYTRRVLSLRGGSVSCEEKEKLDVEYNILPFVKALNLYLDCNNFSRPKTYQLI